jgi:hypothetical protein
MTKIVYGQHSEDGTEWREITDKAEWDRLTAPVRPELSAYELAIDGRIIGKASPRTWWQRVRFLLA